MQQKTLDILPMGLVSYAEALDFQKKRVASRIEGKVNDSLLLVEHHPVVTLGRRAQSSEVHVSEAHLHAQGIDLFSVERGGMATYHGPGQLVAYPIIKLPRKGLAFFMDALLNAIERTVQSFGLPTQRSVNGPGIWVQGAKIASVGIALRKWVTFHGMALNVNTDLQGFSFISPCGNPSERITSLQKELGYDLDMAMVTQRFVDYFAQELDMPLTKEPPVRRPPWLKLAAPHAKEAKPVARMVEHLHLHTVCQEARCPNKNECFARGTSTFIIMGDVCTRACRYCAVEKGTPRPLDITEPTHVAQAVQQLALQHAVITSVTRDDIADGGAAHFVATIEAVRKHNPQTSIEVLVPDFQGNLQYVQQVCVAKPDMFNHNIETVQRLFPLIRPRASYTDSLKVLAHAAEQGLRVKSGIMLGLGESWDEIRATLQDLYAHGCRYATLGQYIAPSRKHAAVMRYPAPDEFQHWKDVALSIGFIGVAAAPLVRSSYRAEDMM